MSDDIVRAWLDGLAKRGVSVGLRNNRLELRPARAYKELTDDEVLTLRHHRDAIKEVIRHAGPSVVEGKPPGALNATFALALENNDATTKAQSTCPYCGATPCIGEQHPHYERIHRHDPQVAAAIEQRETERKQREDEEEFRLMLRTIGRSFYGW